MAGLLAARLAPAAVAPAPLKLSIFSKHLRFLEGDALAPGAAELGFDGIDLAVRKGGHIETDRVAEELPRFIRSAKQHGLEITMLTTDIVDAATPNAERILQAMQTAGLRHYRWGGFTFDYSRPLAQQLEALKPRVAKLAELNKRYGVTAMYHTHSGTGVVGASIWDLHIILKDFDPALVGINYDIGHATIEGGVGGWINSFYISQPHLAGLAVKDCAWVKSAKGWKAEFVPLGTGMVHMQQFFAMVKKSAFQGPLQLHFEYPLGGAEGGKRTLTMEQPAVYSAMRQDVLALRSFLKEAAL